jgi:hypothetical protein
MDSAIAIFEGMHVNEAEGDGSGVDNTLDFASLHPAVCREHPLHEARRGRPVGVRRSELIREFGFEKIVTERSLLI